MGVSVLVIALLYQTQSPCQGVAYTTCAQLDLHTQGRSLSASRARRYAGIPLPPCFPATRRSAPLARGGQVVGGQFGQCGAVQASASGRVQRSAPHTLQSTCMPGVLTLSSIS